MCLLLVIEHFVLLLEVLGEGLVVLSLALAIEEQAIVRVHKLTLVDGASPLLIRVDSCGPRGVSIARCALDKTFLTILLLDRLDVVFNVWSLPSIGVKELSHLCSSSIGRVVCRIHIFLVAQVAVVLVACLFTPLIRRHIVHVVIDVSVGKDGSLACVKIGPFLFCRLWASTYGCAVCHSIERALLNLLLLGIQQVKQG